MNFESTPLAGAYILEMARSDDERGFFARSFCAREWTAHGLNPAISQCSISFNARRGTLRGLHYQAAPHQEDKIVRCTAGSIYDVIVDLRPESPTHRGWFGLELSAANRRSLYVPQGFAHGFISLADASEVLYMISVPYAPQAVRGIRWDDPALAIRWPMAPVVVSVRDAALPLLDSPSALMPVKRVLVSGAGGFIGRWSVPALLDAGYEVHAVLRSLDRAIPAPLQGARLHAADLLDLRAVEALLDLLRPTHLLHFAWIATPGEYQLSSDNLRWLNAGRELLAAFAARGGRRVVMAGSCAEYDWSQAGICDERTTALADASAVPPTPYAACKLAMQRSLQEFAAERALSAAWGRIFFLYGPAEHPQRLVASVIVNLLAGRAAPASLGTQIRSFLHVADVGAAFAALLDSQVEGVVNIGSDECIAVRDLLALIAARIGRPELLHLGARRVSPGEPAILVPNIRRLQAEVGWRPRTNLTDGLADTIAWWRSHDPAR